MTWAPIDGKGYTLEALKTHLDGLKIFPGAKFCEVHSTGAPSLVQWYHTAHWAPDRRIHESLVSYYRDQKKWHAGPHLFVDQDFIWGFTPMTSAGVHSPSWNDRAIGMEIVGNMDVEQFRLPQRQLVVGALGLLHKKMGWDPAKYIRGVSGLHFHKEDPKTDHHNCPGKNVIKPQLLKDVQNYMLNGTLPA